MKHLFQHNAVASPPSKPTGLRSEGYPSNGSKAGGQPATDIGAYWYYMIGEEIENAIKGGGLTPNGDELDQLNRAIEARLAKFKTDLLGKLATLEKLFGSFQAIPPGCGMDWYSNLPVPDGWYLCDGRAVSRTGDAPLFAAIGTTHGAGDGVSTFNLPNTIHRFCEGGTLDESGKFIPAGLPNIRGSVFGTNNWGMNPTGAFRRISTYSARYRWGDNDDWGAVMELDASRANSVFGKSNTVQPEAIIVPRIIKR